MSATKNATIAMTAAPSVTARKFTRNFSRSVAGRSFIVVRCAFVCMFAKIHVPLAMTMNK